MHNCRLATRYARSLITLAQEKNQTESVLKDMEYLDELVKMSRDFTLVLRSPVINPDKKLAIINAVAGGKIGVLSEGFITLLVKKGREFFLPEMAEAYISQYKELNKIHDVRLSTAVKIGDDLVQQIKAKAASSISDGTVNLEVVTDEKLIGGFVLETGDKLYDASVRKELNQIKKQFTKNPYTSVM